ncbi:MULTISPECIES: type II secretion system F family protein [unclassified Clostridium]|uniref:type II secretion system F family protein n=1 Tax=unclassified Clostridium TaxID=2614128 RepID=UPI00029817F5|nr:MULTISPECIES: type II secretion system F family protein [unclassified Clostridium]EKQ58193.1 MAG: type II secretory pathway, component PulF [Clostridium sp. Maddingley MBC34-26]
MHNSNTQNIYNENYSSDLNYKKKSKEFKSFPLFQNKVREKQLSLISGNLAQLYKDGITITYALELVADILPDKIYKNNLTNVLGAINRGESLSQGFSEYKNLYPDFFIGMISIGENTGKLYEVLRGLNIYYDKLLFIKKEIKNASTYPMFIFASIVILGIFLLNIVVPNFCEIYKSMNIPMPASCKLLYDINLSIKSNPVLVGITLTSWTLLLAIILRLICKKITVDKFIKIKIVKSFFEYIMVILFSIITSTGINISIALKYCENSISFTYLRKKIKMINEDILRGSTLTESLDNSGLFSKYTLAIVRIREESGSIEEGFKELANKLENELFEKISKYLKLINPIFMLIMASFIVMFMIGFVIPLFDNLKNGIR